MERKYTHINPGEEGKDLPWQYRVLEEHLFEYKGREVLYIISEVVSGSVCIGIGTLRYIYVPGIVISRYSGLDKDCRPISTVMPVGNTVERDAIERLLSEKHPSMQICFDCFQQGK